MTPPSPLYNPDQKEANTSQLNPLGKHNIRPKLLSPNYTPKQKDDPTLVDNLEPLVKEEDQKEDNGEEQDKEKDKKMNMKRELRF